MKYILTVTSDEPLWHDLKAFDGRQYTRRDHALYGLRCAIYEAMNVKALRDRPIAHELMRWINWCETNKVPNPGYMVDKEGAGFTFRVTCYD